MIQWLESLGSIISQNSQFFSGLLDAVAYAYNFIIRWIMPVLACAILYRCLRPLLAIKLQPEIWAYIALPNGARIPVSHWENTIGRSPSSDIVINYPTVSRTHAVFTRNDDGDWTITNLTSKANIRINGRPAEGSSSVKPGDTIELHGAELVLLPAEAENQKEEHRPKIYRPGYTFLLMTVFQILTAVQLVLSARDSSGRLSIVFVFAGLILSMWLYFALMRLRRRTGFEVETIALFLSTLGLSVAASADPAFLPKQFVALLMGFALFVFLGWFIKDLERAKRTRWLMGGISLALLAAVFILGRTVYGARNWIFIGSFSFQPSELVKITFVFAGASTLDRLFTKRNLNLFIVFSGICIGTIALLGDFGTALIFFAAFIVIAFIRSGDLATISLIIAGTGFAGFLALRIKPYIADRFSAWLHVWDYAHSLGYQQTRTLMYAASGGLLGLGAGKGFLKSITAADTDLVFGVLCEEWGLIIAACCVISLICIALYTVRCSRASRSSFYVIASCASITMLLFQTALNVFGSVDFLPLTGVTFPFISNGGTSMISSWGLLAFIKAADTRESLISKALKEAA